MPHTGALAEADACKSQAAGIIRIWCSVCFDEVTSVPSLEQPQPLKLQLQARARGEIMHAEARSVPEHWQQTRRGELSEDVVQRLALIPL